MVAIDVQPASRCSGDAVLAMAARHRSDPFVDTAADRSFAYCDQIVPAAETFLLRKVASTKKEEKPAIVTENDSLNKLFMPTSRPLLSYINENYQNLTHRYCMFMERCSDLCIHV